MKRHKSDLQSKAQNDQKQGRLPPGRCRKSSDGITYEDAATWRPRGEQSKCHEQECFAKQGQGNVKAARTPSLWRVVMRDQSVSREAHQRVEEVEADHIGSKKHTEVSCQRAQPPHGKALGPHSDAVARMNTACDP